MQENFTKKDWTLFKTKVADWQEAYMDRLCREYMELLSENADASDRFWKLEERIRKDTKKTGVQLDMRRSNFIYNILSLLNEGVIGFADLEDFSDGLKETVQFLVER